MPSCLQSSDRISYDAFRHFKRVYFLGDAEPEKRLVAVFSTMGDFTFYGDESTGDEVDAYSVAGYLASVERWESFIKEWKRFQADEGFTVLHKRLLEHNVRGSEFEWPNLSKNEKAEKKKRINARACDIILRHAMVGLSVAVQKSAWQAFVAQEDPQLTRMLGRSFYAMGVLWCLTMAAIEFENKRKVGMIRYVFEHGPGQGEAFNMLEAMKREPIDRDTYRIAGFSFEDKKDPEFIPLQAADFLAYETYRQIDNQIFGRGEKLTAEGKRIRMRGALRCLLRADDPVYGPVAPADLPVPHIDVWLSKSGIEYFAAHVRETFNRAIRSK